MNMATPSHGTTPFRIFFGGPDCQPRTQRDLLKAPVSAVPSGGEILWTTYYFRDEALAEALVHANHELLVVSADPFLFDAFRDRWEQMIKETQAMPS